MATRPTKRMTIGTDLEFPVEINNTYGNPLTGYKSDNALSCVITRGDDQAPLATPTIGWRSTGQGLINVKVSRADTAGLEPGTYAILGFVEEYDGDRKCIFDGDLVLSRGPGMAALPKSYGTYDQMLRSYGPLAAIPLPDGAETGWAEQRQDAREWLDDRIVDAVRDADKAKVRGWLDDDALTVDSRVARIATYKALAEALGSQITTDDSSVAGGRRSAHEPARKDFEAKLAEEMALLIARFDVDEDGEAEESVDVRGGAFVMSTPTLEVGYLRFGSRYRYDPEC